MAAPPRLVLFTDLDGTLLASDTYEPGPARQALAACGRAGVPVVIVSSKTRAEIQEIRDRLGQKGPFISENGGGLYLPREAWPCPPGWEEAGPFWRLALGRPYPEVLAVLQKAAARCRIKIRGFASMSLQEVMERTGLSPDQARLATQREFDEPLVAGTGGASSLTCLEREVHAAGFTLTRGGRFLHVMGDCDKGRAAARILALFRERSPAAFCAAIGDAVNDLPLLRLADHPFLVRRPGGEWDHTAWFEGVTVTRGIGPRGFREAVEGLLTTLGKRGL